MPTSSPPTPEPVNPPPRETPETGGERGRATDPARGAPDADTARPEEQKRIERFPER